MDLAKLFSTDASVPTKTGGGGSVLNTSVPISQSGTQSAPGVFASQLHSLSSAPQGQQNMSKSPFTQQVSPSSNTPASTVASVNNSSSESASMVAKGTITQPTEIATADVTKTSASDAMGEGEVVLNRLKEADKQLQKGNSLPPETKVAMVGDKASQANLTAPVVGVKTGNEQSSQTLTGQVADDTWLSPGGKTTTVTPAEMTTVDESKPVKGEHGKGAANVAAGSNLVSSSRLSPSEQGVSALNAELSSSELQPSTSSPIKGSALQAGVAQAMTMQSGLGKTQGKTSGDNGTVGSTDETGTPFKPARHASNLEAETLNKAVVSAAVLDSDGMDRALQTKPVKSDAETIKPLAEKGAQSNKLDSTLNSQWHQTDVEKGLAATTDFPEHSELPLARLAGSQTALSPTALSQTVASNAVASETVIAERELGHTVSRNPLQAAGATPLVAEQSTQPFVDSGLAAPQAISLSKQFPGGEQQAMNHVDPAQRMQSGELAWPALEKQTLAHVPFQGEKEVASVAEMPKQVIDQGDVLNVVPIPTELDVEVDSLGAQSHQGLADVAGVTASVNTHNDIPWQVNELDASTSVQSAQAFTAMTGGSEELIGEQQPEFATSDVATDVLDPAVVAVASGVSAPVAARQTVSTGQMSSERTKGTPASSMMSAGVVADDTALDESAGRQSASPHMTAQSVTSGNTLSPKEVSNEATTRDLTQGMLRQPNGEVQAKTSENVMETQSKPSLDLLTAARAAPTVAAASASTQPLSAAAERTIKTATAARAVGHVADEHGATDAAQSAPRQFQAGLQQALGAQGLRAEAAQPPMNMQPGEGQQAITEKVQMMLSNNLKQVDIRLDPPELGRMQIKLNLNQDQASVQFTVSSSQAKEVVEQTMPRLREMLNQQGLQLAQGNVQQDASGRQSQQQGNGMMNMANGNGNQGNQGGSGQNGTPDWTQTAASDEQIELFVDERQEGVDYYA
ncbi:flagellar hook-length control protein FliK [Thaumasiovibrio subtropicus]|uniref:flagellar hook-length control protein FliK n=1 Tax=Thaumasiovibrio subtropicus TaxID=1891207 RepID=UPI000B34B767|nr:flagellar hook-length control protein FliK [Thaumasiovibrio subtropicus]